MEESDLVPDCWHELEANQKGSRQDGEEMEHHCGLERVLEIVVAFSRRCTGLCRVGIAEYTVEG